MQEHSREHTIESEVVGPWSLSTSRAFWEGFSPNALDGPAGQGENEQIHTVFRVEADWSRAVTDVTQHGQRARISLTGDGDLDAAAEQVRRFLSLDVDGRGWHEVADRDPVDPRPPRPAAGSG